MLFNLVAIMDNIKLLTQENQAKLDKEIRLICRRVLVRGINKSAPMMGMVPGTLWNQLTDGRTKKIPAVTVATISALTGNIRPLDKMCRAAGHIALPVDNPAEKEYDSRLLTGNILQNLGLMLIDLKNRQENGRDLMRQIFQLANKDAG